MYEIHENIFNLYFFQLSKLYAWEMVRKCPFCPFFTLGLLFVLFSFQTPFFILFSLNTFSTLSTQNVAHPFHIIFLFFYIYTVKLYILYICFLQNLNNWKINFNMNVNLHFEIKRPRPENWKLKVYFYNSLCFWIEMGTWVGFLGWFVLSLAVQLRGFLLDLRCVLNFKTVCSKSCYYFIMQIFSLAEDLRKN